MTGGLILNALSMGVSGGSGGQTILQQIDAMTTLSSGTICTGYTYKVKYGHLRSLYPYSMGRTTGYYDDTVIYVNQIWQPYEWYFCVYSGNTIKEAVRLPMRTQRECSEWAIEQYADTHSGGAGYTILLDDEWHCDSITSNMCQLNYSSGWQDFNVSLNLDITYNGTYTDHNWTSTSPGQYVDNPTTSSYTQNDSISYASVVAKTGDYDVYTDLSDAAYQTFLCDIALAIHND